MSLGICGEVERRVDAAAVGVIASHKPGSEAAPHRHTAVFVALGSGLHVGWGPFGELAAEDQRGPDENHRDDEHHESGPNGKPDPAGYRFGLRHALRVPVLGCATFQVTLGRGPASRLAPTLVDMSDSSLDEDLAGEPSEDPLAEFAAFYDDFDDEPTEAERVAAVDEFLADAGRFRGVGDSLDRARQGEIEADYGG